jgi:hypothetical protein
MQSIIYESFSNAFELLLASIVVIYSYTWPTIFIKKYNEDKNEDLPFKLVILDSFFGNNRSCNYFDNNLFFKNSWVGKR